MRVLHHGLDCRPGVRWVRGSVHGPALGHCLDQQPHSVNHELVVSTALDKVHPPDREWDLLRDPAFDANTEYG